MPETTTSVEFTKEQCLTGMCAAVSILDKWRVSSEQACRILRISRSVYAGAKHRTPGRTVALGADQMERISLVLNIHAALRLVFENPKNLYEFVSMANHNDFFNGRSPLETIAQGDKQSLYETFRRIDALKPGYPTS